MEVFTKIGELQEFIQSFKRLGKSIGFVPTMGALHTGHLSLVEKCASENDLSIVSIFVNPTQFNNPSDFEKYPIQNEIDLQFLKNSKCQVVFLPSKEEIYPESYILPKIDLGLLDSTMEGSFRPGHFDGVVQVVYRLFDIVQADNAYFGLKDFQQLAVIRQMVSYFDLKISIIACPTVRNESGLALSSRNVRLSVEEQEKALFIYQSLKKAKILQKEKSPLEIMHILEQDFKRSDLSLEYFQIIDPITFQTLEKEWVPNAVACVVAYLNKVRLIDNMQLN